MCAPHLRGLREEIIAALLLHVSADQDSVFRTIAATWATLESYWDQNSVIFGGHFGHFGVSLGSIRDHFGSFLCVYPIFAVFTVILRLYNTCFA